MPSDTLMSVAAVTLRSDPRRRVPCSVDGTQPMATASGWSLL